MGWGQTLLAARSAKNLGPRMHVHRWSLEVILGLDRWLPTPSSEGVTKPGLLRTQKRPLLVAFFVII